MVFVVARKVQELEGRSSYMLQRFILVTGRKSVPPQYPHRAHTPAHLKVVVTEPIKERGEAGKARVPPQPAFEWYVLQRYNAGPGFEVCGGVQESIH